ncbi:MAG: ATP-binding cassette domain-containing protein, partial [Sulfitobacter sp.]
DLFPALERFWSKQAWSLSGGQKQMLAVARAIIEPRALILIDEPTKGLAPSIVAAMGEAFREISQTTTILLVEQNFNFARSLGRDMAVIEDGRVVHNGSMADFAANADLQGRLLGLSA